MSNLKKKPLTRSEILEKDIANFDVTINGTPLVGAFDVEKFGLNLDEEDLFEELDFIESEAYTLRVRNAGNRDFPRSFTLESTDSNVYRFTIK